MRKLFTIGHSNHGTSDFIDLLKANKVTAIGDVRSLPYSRFFPQYSKDVLKDFLALNEVSYFSWGDELGARSKNPACYRHGRVQYDLLSQEKSFSSGLKKIIEALESHTIALMCSEKDPIDCHRALLVGRKIFEQGIDLDHIHRDGSLEAHLELEGRLLEKWNMQETDMFSSREDLIKNAYSLQGERVAYQDEKLS